MIYNENPFIIIRGGGDLATGVIQKFYRSGFHILVLELPEPTAIRRTVALSEAIYDGHAAVEDMLCRKIETLAEAEACYAEGIIPMMVDPKGQTIKTKRPHAVIDATIAKRNLGTCIHDAPITIGLGPGFYAGRDVHAVIETMRGHSLGQLVLEGSAMPDTGIPGEISGKSAQRVLHAPIGGKIKHMASIGDIVMEGEDIFAISGHRVTAPFTGRIRGLIRNGMTVRAGMKISDIDPRLDVNWNTISDKARCLGGAALEAYFYLDKQYTQGESYDARRTRICT